MTRLNRGLLLFAPLLVCVTCSCFYGSVRSCLEVSTSQPPLWTGWIKCVTPEDKTHVGKRNQPSTTRDRSKTRTRLSKPKKCTADAMNADGATQPERTCQDRQATYRGIGYLLHLRRHRHHYQSAHPPSLLVCLACLGHTCSIMFQKRHNEVAMPSAHLRP